MIPLNDGQVVRYPSLQLGKEEPCQRSFEQYRLTPFRQPRLSADFDASMDPSDADLALGHYRNMSGTTICTSPVSMSPQESTPSTSLESGYEDLNQAIDSIDSAKPDRSIASKNRKEVTSICEIIEKCKSSSVRARFVLEQDKLWHDKATMKASHNHTHEAISLADALDGGAKISAKSKHILYVLVAYSLL